MRLKKIHHSLIQSLSSAGTKAPTQVEDRMMLLTLVKFNQLKLGLYRPWPQFYAEFTSSQAPK